MSLRFQSQLLVDAIADEQLENQFEVLMPRLDLFGGAKKSDGGLLSTIITGIQNTFSSYTPIVEEITFGVKNFKTQTRRVRTGWVNVPEDIEQYHDVAITMFVSSGMLTQQYLSSWKALMFNADGEYYNPMTWYKKNIEVFFWGPGNVNIPVAHYTLAGCFPYAQEDFKLSYKSEPQRLRITQRFKVDKIITDRTTAKSSIIQELVTSPGSVVDTLISTATSKLAGSDRDYDIKKMYD